MPDGLNPQNKDPRDLTNEERRANFAAMKKALSTPTTPEPSIMRWHKVDCPLSGDQYDDLPSGQPGIQSRVGLFWIQYRHDVLRRLVVAKGYFDHEDCSWTARYRPEEDEDRGIRKMTAIAWARVVRGERPWDGPVISKRHEDEKL